MDTTLLVILLVLVVAYIVGLSAIDTAAGQRKNVEKGMAMMLGLFFTPIAWLLFCLCFPLKDSRSIDEKKS